ncbi:crotonase/enoyl-CoA hydratase family protein [Vineibacter terrae]|uniref:Crotonase/enoyl-CoA hydratase family protein n=1 Tax=Vineibacter terrae TaxID=2586908 RepID=A0A5C8P783_9HYPH|nr:crotonase/enoyl-CoA hydratase family protein [Vineibacter terrae]TXL69485.1 crotonase/enoyl-CoA hydratase family protein [Vineibacter terrae]
MARDDLVLYDRHDHIVTITLNDPGTRNALYEGGLIDALAAALARLTEDAEARVAILTGAGTAFSAGADLKQMTGEQGIWSRKPLDMMAFYRDGIQRIPLTLERLEIPIIAAVNGPAYGAGCDIACMCDIRLASATAVFCEVFVRLGVVSGDGGAWYIPRVIGASRYAEMAFTGDPVDAEEALRIGLVSRVVPPEALMDEARRLAGRIARNAPQALRMTKRLLREGRHQRIDSHLEMTAALMSLCHTTDDNREGMLAALHKRPPRFEGK